MSYICLATELTKAAAIKLKKKSRSLDFNHMSTEMSINANGKSNMVNVTLGVHFIPITFRQL